MLNILHVKLSAKELRREGDTLDEYKIAKTMKHTCLVVTFYVCYKMTSTIK